MKRITLRVRGIFFSFAVFNSEPSKVTKPQIMALITDKFLLILSQIFFNPKVIRNTKLRQKNSSSPCSYCKFC